MCVCVFFSLFLFRHGTANFVVRLCNDNKVNSILRWIAGHLSLMKADGRIRKKDS